MAQVAKKTKAVAAGKACKERKVKPEGAKKYVSGSIPKDVKPATAVEMAAKTVALIVTFSGISNNRRVDTALVDVDTDKTAIRVTKELIHPRVMAIIGAIEGEAKRYLHRRALPSMLKRGVYLLPNEFIGEVDARLTELAARRSELVEKLILDLEDHIAAAKKRLKTLFNKNEYPTVDYIRSSFTMTWQYISFNTPASLEQINREIYQKEQAKAEVAWKQLGEDVQGIMRARMAELVAHLVDKLTPDNKGKQKKFKNSTVGNLQEFLAGLNVQDITNDAKLRTLAEQTRQLIEGVDPEALRSTDTVRERVLTGFQKIEKALEPLLEERPLRHIALED